MVVVEGGTISLTNLYLQKSPFGWTAGRLGLFSAYDTLIGVLLTGWSCSYSRSR